MAFEGYCTDVFFEEGIKFIREHQDESFFCYIATNAPHGPLNVEPRYIDMYRDEAPDESKARFYGMVTNIDENVGKLRQELEALGLADDTIIVFMTDNGSCGGVTLGEDSHVDEGPFNYNAGMRGKKGSEYEGGHRVPFILHHPDMSTAQQFNELTTYIDFMPTMLDLCHIDVPEERSFHGTSLKPLIDKGQQAELNQRFFVTDTQRLARPVKWRKSCVIHDHWRFVNGRELYDISRDPGQRENIIEEYPELVPKMRDAYEDWWETVSGQFDRDVPFALGGSDETVILTTHDIRNEASDSAWHQSQVRAGKAVSGYWAVDIRKAGTYTIELRRWDRSTGYKITSGIDGDDSGWRKDCIVERLKYHYEDGKALDLRWASLTIAGENYQAEIEDGAEGVTFKVDLPLGETQLYAAFHGYVEQTMAPYYIYVNSN